jgi:hypothetical protein
MYVTTPYYFIKNDKIYSAELTVTDLVGEKLNFTTIKLFPNGTNINDMKISFNFRENFTFNFIALSTTVIDNECDFYTSVFETEKIFFFVTPGELYTSYEKVYLPFDYETWMYLCITFACAFAMIFIINRLNKNIQDIVYGENVQTPAFNIVSIFFGIGQVKLPTANFARILLVTFLYFCMIIRNAYQEVQFEMFTSDLRKPSPKTIDQLYDFNYSIILWTQNNNFIGISDWFYTLTDASKR